MSFYVNLIDPPPKNPATLDAGIFVLLDSIAVIDLNFVSAHQIHARIGMFRNTKLDVYFDVAELFFRNEFHSSPAPAVHKHALTGRDEKFIRVRGIQSDAFGHPPIAGWF